MVQEIYILWVWVEGEALVPDTEIHPCLTKPWHCSELHGLLGRKKISVVVTKH